MGSVGVFKVLIVTLLYIYIYIYKYLSNYTKTIDYTTVSYMKTTTSCTPQ